MMTTRLLTSLLGCMFINLNMTTCQSPGDKEKTAPSKAEPRVITLPGVDTTQLTPREKSQWSAHVTELLAPCQDTPVNIAECVENKRDCAACLPAARFLKTQVTQGRTPGQVEAAYEGRFAEDQVKDIDIADSPVKGAPDAPITIVEWADFECPACKAASPMLNEVVKGNQDVRLVFKNYPLDIHPEAENAARAVMAARRQGQFWEMHDALFAMTAPPTESRILETARGLGLDMEAFEADLRSEKVADLVARDRKQGEAVDLAGTPTIYINGRQFAFQSDLQADLEAWIEMERQILGLEQ